MARQTPPAATAPQRAPAATAPAAKIVSQRLGVLFFFCIFSLGFDFQSIFLTGPSGILLFFTVFLGNFELSSKCRLLRRPPKRGVFFK